MNWLAITLIAHFLFALVFVIDKFLLSKTNINPLVYAFYGGLLQSFALLLIPFGFFVPSGQEILISFLAGALFIFAVLFLYKSFRFYEVSKIAPVVGGAIPIFVLLLSYFFLDDQLSPKQLIAFGLLVLGGLIALWPQKNPKISQLTENFWLKGLSIAFLAAFFFAASFALTKLVYNSQPFINGFIWIRLGGFLGAIILLIWPKNWSTILNRTKAIKIKTITLFSTNKLIAALAFILLNYAIYLGNVSLINALQGVQYAFLFIVLLIFSKKYPQILREQINSAIIIKKVAAIILISLALGLLTF